MRSRNDYDRSYGYGGRSGEENRGQYSDGGYSQGRSRYADDDRNERYFGGSLRYGEGYSDTDYQRGRGAFGRGLGSYRSDQQDDRFFGENYPDRDDYDRYYEDSPRRGPSSAGYGGGYTTGIDRSYRSSGAGDQGYSPSSYRTTDYRTSRGYYSPDYPGSESGYYSGRSGGRNDRGWWDRTSDEVASWFGDEEAERRREMDARREGNYRGKGPKGYTRSDDRIKEDVSDRLEDHSYLDASDIDIEVNSGDVVLSGTVESRYAKRLAEDLAEDCSGVKNVENRLKIDSDWYNNRYGSTTSSGTSTSYTSSDTQSKTATSR
jgi:osmotically-inducible protein OsmY